MTFLTPGVAFLLTVALGLWLSRVGKPYNGRLFNVHKLIALGAVVVTTLELNQALQEAAASPGLIALLIAAGVGVAALFASGALMSLAKLDYTAMRSVHRIAPILVILAVGAAVYVLAVRQHGG